MPRSAAQVTNLTTARQSGTLPQEPYDFGAIISHSASITWTSIAANTTQEQSVTVLGASAGNNVDVTPVSSPGAGLLWTGYVSTSGTVVVRMANVTTGAITPNTVSWRIDVS